MELMKEEYNSGIVWEKQDNVWAIVKDKDICTER